MWDDVEGCNGEESEEIRLSVGSDKGGERDGGTFDRSGPDR